MMGQPCDPCRALGLAQDGTSVALRERIKAYLDLPGTKQLLAQDPRFTALFGTRRTRRVAVAAASSDEPGASLIGHAVDRGFAPSPPPDEADLPVQGPVPLPPCQLCFRPPPNPDLFPTHPHYYIANNLGSL